MDLDSVFRDYEIEDKSTLRSLLYARLDLEQLAGEYDKGLRTIEEIRATQEKPSAKLTSGIISPAILQAAIETKSTSGSAYEESFKRHTLEAVNGLPWDIVQDDIKQTYAGSRVYTQSVALAGVKTDLDLGVQKSGGARQPTSLALPH
jgi:hypothetical protein